MKPVRITVRAFGPYAAEQVFDFAHLAGRSFFLIHGPTGAGKTSILDAICFALYGQASGTLRLPKQLRSDHADPGTLTTVTFDFRVGERRYRVERVPEQERPKKRGSGTVVHQMDATIWDRTKAAADDDKDPGEVLADGWTDVTAEVERLMGFRCEQFRQVVMLPQGQFQRLLTDKSADRQAILETLFQVHDYGRIERALHDAALDLRRREDRTRTVRDEMLRATGAADPDALAERRAQLEADLRDARAAAAGLRDAQRAARSQLAEAKAAAEALRERDEARESLRRWEARHAEYANKQDQHARACKAMALIEAESALDRLRADATTLRQKHERLRSTLDLAKSAKAKADAALAAEAAREPQREALRQEAARLDELAAKARELDAARQKAAIAARAHATADDARRRAEQSLSVRREKITSLDARRLELEAANNQLTALQLQLQVATRRRDERTQLDDLTRKLAAAEAKARRLEERTDADGQLLRFARDTRGRLQDQWNSGQAAVLAAALAGGAPCPVCGSTHHPHPATAAGHVPSESDLREAAAVVESREKALADSQRDSVELQQQVATLRTRLQSLHESLDMQIGTDAVAFDAEVGRLEQALSQAEQAGIELQTVRHTLEGLRGQETLAARMLTDAEAILAAAAADFAGAQALAADREAAVPQHLREGGAADRERLQVAARLKAAADAFEAARKTAAAADVALAKAESDLSNAADTAAAAQRRAEEAEGEFAAKLVAAGFADPGGAAADSEAFARSKRTQAQVDQLDADLREYHDSLAAARERFERATTAAEHLAPPDVAALEAAARAADDALEQNVGRANVLAEQLKQTDAALSRLAELDAELRSLDARYAQVGRIAEVAAGRNEYRTTFQRYVLGAFLDEVLRGATARLRIMTRGRFVLRRTRDPATGRVAGGGGLDLEVFDGHTDTARPVASLSGGEGFLASLALALGLADVVQAHAGGIRLETIFIDEGFGTLDPESLDLAIRALRDLQQGGRLVGIISHVTELKELIDARLEVLPGTRGSTARFVVG